MENKTNERTARRISVIFVVVIGCILCGMVACILALPYDSGVLMSTGLSGNNQYGGELATSNDYLFFARDGKIMRLDYNTNQTEAIYEGEADNLNPYDGWLYFVHEGTILRIGYYGGTPTRLGTHSNVKSMTVNGLWLYYLTDDGVIHKIRSDGEKQSDLTDGSIRYDGFESANRILLATDGKQIYRMKTDGTDCTVLVKGSNITRMLYTLDNLYYCDNGVVKEMKSVEAGQDDGTQYQELQADVFTYNVNSENRGVLYYVKGNELRAYLLESYEHEEAEDKLLTTAEDVTDLYSVDSDLYYHNSQGDLFMVRINDAECTVEPVK